MRRLLMFLLVWGLLAAGVSGREPEVGNVKLLRDAQIPIMSGERRVGSVTVKAGTEVKVVREREGKLEVAHNEMTFTLDSADTDYEERLATLKKQAEARRVRKQEKRAREDAEDEARARAKEAELARPENKAIRPDDLAVGKVGRLLTHGGEPAAVEIQQVINASEFLGTVGRSTVYFRGISTERMVDGKSYTFPTAVFSVTRTTQYVTVLGGTKTVFVMEPLRP